MNIEYLTKEQVNKLNEEHGWFAFGDAQGDVSRAFAADAIKLHEAIRQSAPDLLKALNDLVCACNALPDDAIAGRISLNNALKQGAELLEKLG